MMPAAMKLIKYIFILLSQKYFDHMNEYNVHIIKNKKKHNLHLARAVDWDSRRLRRTSNGDRDVEGQVVSVVSGDVYATLNATERGREEADQLNLTVVRDNARKGSLNRLAHVAKNDGASGSSLGNESGKRTRTSRGHITRRVVANDVAGRRSEIKCYCGTISDDGGGVVEHAVGLNLTDEALNGRHLIFRT